MTNSDDQNTKDLPNVPKKDLPSELRRTLLKAAWVTPMVTVVSIPVHAQTSATTTPEPNVAFEYLEFTGPGNNDDLVGGEYTGQLEVLAAKISGLGLTKSGFDFTGWTVKITVKVTKEDGSSRTKTFTVPVAADGSFALSLAEDAIWDDLCVPGGGSKWYHILKDVSATAKLFNPSGEIRDTIELLSENEGDGDPARYCLVGGPCTTPTPTTTT